MYTKESALEKEPPPVVKCDYYKVERVVTGEFDEEWLDTIEQECGIRPEIIESFIITPDIGHHLCSAKRHTLAWSMGYVLSNFREIEEKVYQKAQAIEHMLMKIHDSEESAKYFPYREFWKDFQDDDWKPDVRIPDTVVGHHLPQPGPWIEYVGTYDDAKLGKYELHQIFCGEMIDAELDDEQ